MAIAYDASSEGTATDTSLTVSHTCSGSNRYLLSFIRTNGTTDKVSGVTYAGQAMTRINTLSDGDDRRIYLYYKIAPASGANNIVASFTESVSAGAQSYSYTGVKQTGQPDASNTQLRTSTNSASIGLTVVASGCWIATGSVNNEASPNSATNFTERLDTGGFASGDTNGTVSAGSNTLTWGYGSTINEVALLAASFSPAPDEGGFFYMSV